MNLICPQCGKENPRHGYQICRATGCMDYLCSEQCADAHEHQKHMGTPQSYLNSLMGIGSQAQSQYSIQTDSLAHNFRQSPEDSRMRRMIAAFDWNRAFSLRYFDEFFAQFPE